MKKLKHGIYNIFKPPGPTSHDIVNLVRKISGEKRVGHAGTLDPFAEGVLIVAVGREYTKKMGQLLKQNKTYRAAIRLGASSDTHDLTGRIVLSENYVKPAKKDIFSALKKFTGEIIQTPPSFSAVKVKGKKAYELARKGATPKLKPRKVKIYYIKILKYKWPFLEIETKVSSGTYIRAIARDLGEVLKTGGYLEKLIRTKVGRYNIGKSVKLDRLIKNI
ncbi:MAG: tRNA pseudouridine(55) synthase TruB [Candidatus Yanofskybacteria bacterium]|nr:tRNA pseudouridine(55) synthase TruB [Candidatus Yanofskybacteria bacterium]